jgi:prepilin-type N-terminal cleavage/methylation domain-containing protein
MHRKGLTLLELVVVMVILVALAAILVPLLPSMLGKAHTSTGATNITELAKWIETFHASKLKYPNEFDSLCDSDGLYEKLPGYVSPTAAGGQITYGALTSTEAAGLVSAGITLLRGMNSSTASATFAPYSTTNDIDLTAATTPSVALANTARVKELFNDDTTETQKFVIFGIGAQCTAVGRGGMLLEAPIHFGDEADANPTQTYQRFGAIFEVTDGEVRFVGVVAIHGKELDSAMGPLKEYFRQS